jgi:hypothetical protein
MNVQKVSDEIAAARMAAYDLPETPLKRLLLAHLNDASSALTQFSEAIMATLDNMEARLKGK